MRGRGKTSLGDGLDWRVEGDGDTNGSRVIALPWHGKTCRLTVNIQAEV